MSRVVSPAKSASPYFFLLFLGAVVVFSGMDARAADAIDAVAMPTHAWCITRSDLPPACEYDDLITCGINAILSGSSCAAAEPRMIAAVTGAAVPLPQPRKLRGPRKPLRIQHNELYKEFLRWSKQHAAQ